MTVEFEGEIIQPSPEMIRRWKKKMREQEGTIKAKDAEIIALMQRNEDLKAFNNELKQNLAVANGRLRETRANLRGLQKRSPPANGDAGNEQMEGDES